MLSAALFICTLILTVVLFRRRKGPSPPGPRGWPIIGNILDIPTKDPWKVLQKWSEDNGSDVVLLRLPGIRILFLNTHRSVQDLLVKRSKIYSDRPKSTMLELMEITWVFALMPYGTTWREHRRIFMREFNIETVRPHALQSARRLLPRLLNSPINYARQIRLSSADAILSATYGISPKSEEDHFVCLAESMSSALTDGHPYLVDMFPILKHIPAWFPGAKFKRQALEWRSLSYDVQNEAYEHVKSKMEGGTAVPCVATNLISSLQSNSLDCSESTTRNILAEAYLGGAGVTVGPLCSFMLTMGLFPEIQAKAHTALIDVVGLDRLPDFSDFGKIPYIDAVINEVLRWNPLAPLGTIVCGNAWALMHDASIYGPSPHNFNPERFLLPDGTRNMAIPDADGAFGFGGRKCPGRAIGRDVIWISIATILCTYEIGEPIGEDGKCLDPAKIQYTNSLNSRPPYFDCTFTVRPGAEALIPTEIKEVA